MVNRPSAASLYEQKEAAKPHSPVGSDFMSKTPEIIEFKLANVKNPKAVAEQNWYFCDDDSNTDVNERYQSTYSGK